jgi:hypothetical protein
MWGAQAETALRTSRTTLARARAQAIPDLYNDAVFPSK